MLQKAGCQPHRMGLGVGQRCHDPGGKISRVDDFLRTRRPGHLSHDLRIRASDDSRERLECRTAFADASCAASQEFWKDVR